VTGPNPHAVGEVAAEHLGPILYALELCALAMGEAGRHEEVEYYRALAHRLAEAGGSDAAGPNVAGGEEVPGSEQ
jgi:hypothetical protein